jgi:uncharacterized protein with NAD-binding domain and iron-sulfur cluster
MTKHVAIFGAGIAGLTTAHELIQRGYRVSVYELNDSAGGFFRSARREEDNLPSEYSWHGFGPWYHNTFDLLQQIPFDATSTLYERVLSRPMEYAVVPDTIDPDFETANLYDKKRAFRMSGPDKLALAWGIVKVWTANTRSRERYARANAAAYWQSRMSKTGHATWKATFGPWIGSDWPYASLHHVGVFFARNIRSGPAHEHAADEHGAAWKHESMGGWSLLRGPSNEWWFNRWIAHLEKAGVEFYWESPLNELHFDGEAITGATVSQDKQVKADIYVLSTTPFSAADVLARTPALEEDEELAKFRALIQNGPHTQVSFRIAFDESISWPRERTAVALVDSEFNITLFANEQTWPSRIDLGEDVKSLWTCTACVASVPGRVHGKPLRNCTKEEFIDEVIAQILASEGLDFMIRRANDGRGLRDFPILKTEVWPEWTFSPNGIMPAQPKWVTTTDTQPHRPSQKTSIPNLVLAGAHTNTEADIWSIEGAVESGRRAAKVFEPGVVVIGQHKPLPLKALAYLDDRLHALRLPHVLTVIAAASAVAMVCVAPRMIRKCGGR